MDVIYYWVGVLFAITSGVFQSIGLLLQKKVIVGLPDDAKFMRNLVKEPLWLIGLFLTIVIAGLFYMLGILFIGPTLVPGLLALGIIILAIGSVKIIGDKLKPSEIIAIILMILSTFLLSFSGLSIEITNKDLLEAGFVMRFTIFTIVLFFLALILQIFQMKSEKFRGFLFAIIAGINYSLVDFWMGLFLGIISHFFGGIILTGEIFLLVISLIILVITNVLAVITLQLSFKHGVASNMMTIQQVPVNINPIIMYLLIFLLIPPSILSIVFLILGSILIIISSYLLGIKQARLEEIR